MIILHGIRVPNYHTETHNYVKFLCMCVYVVLEIKPRALCIIAKYHITELCSLPLKHFLNEKNNNFELV